MELHTIYLKLLECNSISIDTRKIEKDCLFIALKGENFDANTFAKDAIEKGAKYVIIDNPNFYLDEKTILVENSLVLLQNLARHHRENLGTKIIALTGSNGKTTTKELINAVLSEKYKTIATIGNLNNHIGVPLTLLRLTKLTEIAIIEMGANHQKEIEFLCSITQPDFGYITNFGKAHLEGFGGTEGVIKGKSELYNFLSEKSKIAFVNLDDKIQNQKTLKINRITFSSKNEDASLFITNISANPMVELSVDNIKINSNLIGLYNATNICAAVCIGNHFNVDFLKIKTAIENYFPENNRSQIINKKGNEIILDAYNANPSSMEEAIKNFIQLSKTPKIAILGDMFEVGNESINEHKKVVSLFEDEYKIEAFFIGSQFYTVRNKKTNMHFFEKFDDFANHFISKSIENYLILIKGSRGMALERTLELI